MVAVGLWGAQLGTPAIWVLPVAFPLVMAMGGMLGLLGVPIPGIEYGIAASAILLGTAVAFEVRPPIVIAALLVGVFAIFHGHAHGTELPPGHVQEGEAAGFLTGFLHPISGLDHVLAMVAVGLWGAQLGAPAIWVLPVAFPLVMAMGGMLGLIGVPVPGIEYGIAASAILLGAAVLFEVRASLFATALLVGVFAIFHGHAHGTELPPGQSALLYSMGFVIATGCLHALGIGIGAVHRWTWGQKLLRAAGAVVAIGGVFFMWKALA